jgi:hypothetical protein
MENLQLPRSGPFSVDSGFAPKKIFSAAALGIVLLALSGGALWLTRENTLKVLHVKRVWSSGTTAEGGIAFEGEVQTTNFVFKSYELTVDFELANGEVQRFECEFDRFFTGPDEGDPMEVRYLPEDPSQATTSWQHDAMGHMWSWIAITLVMGVVAGAGSLWLVANAIATVRKVKELARSGQLIAVDVLEAKVVESDKVTTVTLKLKLPGGGETSEQYQEGKTDPHFLDNGARVVVLSSLDGQRVHLLRHDGYPLLLE